MIHYRLGNDLDLDAVIACYRASTLAERRPIDDRQAMERMLRHANLVVSAWDDDRLVGLARSFTDFAHCCYLACLAVDQAYQRRGIGRRLMDKTRQQLPASAYLTLLAAPKAVDYYPHQGFERHTSAWIVRAGQSLRPVNEAGRPRE